MSAGFVNLDRQTPLFPPCDLREWLPAGHLVHFILEAVEQKNDGPPSGLTVYAAVGKPGHHKTVADSLPENSTAFTPSRPAVHPGKRWRSWWRNRSWHRG